jgi:hypothetical protein
VILEWVFDVANHFKQNESTAHLACHYLKQLISSPNEPLSQLKLKAVTCIIVASKFDEIDHQIPSARLMLRALNQDIHIKYEEFLVMQE